MNLFEYRRHVNPNHARHVRQAEWYETDHAKLGLLVFYAVCAVATAYWVFSL